MKKLLILSFTLISVLASAQRYKNPRSYLREFTNQNRKIQVKTFRYMEATLKGADERMVTRYREMVTDQLKDSKREISYVGDYNGDETVTKEYIKALDMYINAFEKNFGKADELIKNRYNSYEDLKAYYEATQKAEDEMLEAAYVMEAAEDYFGKRYDTEPMRNEELQQQFIALDEVTLYSRDMTLAFFRVDAQVRAYVAAAKAGNTDTLSDILSDMRLAIRDSREEVKQYSDFEGEDGLLKEVEYYLEDMGEETNNNLNELTDALQNKFAAQDDYEDAQRDLERFIKNHEVRVADFFDERTDLLLEYLPED